MRRHYLRVNKGHCPERPETVLDYVAWDKSSWPFRHATAVVWSADEVTREVVEKERWMMQPRQHRSFEPFP